MGTIQVRGPEIRTEDAGFETIFAQLYRILRSDQVHRRLRREVWLCIVS
jgi:hypothetical protein